MPSRFFDHGVLCFLSERSDGVELLIEQFGTEPRGRRELVQPLFSGLRFVHRLASTANRRSHVGPSFLSLLFAHNQRIRKRCALNVREGRFLSRSQRKLRPSSAFGTFSP